MKEPASIDVDSLVMLVEQQVNALLSAQGAASDELVTSGQHPLDVNLATAIALQALGGVFATLVRPYIEADTWHVVSTVVSSAEELLLENFRRARRDMDGATQGKAQA